MKNSITVIHLSTLLATSLLLFSLGACKSATQVDMGVISGMIQLDNQINNSGIVVSIYNAGIVPSELKQIREEYPQLAFPIDDKLLFDHSR